MAALLNPWLPFREFAMATLQRVCLAVKMNIRTRQKSEIQEAPGAKGKLAWQQVPS